jgi:hypothetical protein
MTVLRVSYLYCDFCDNQDAYDHAPLPNERAEDQRRRARDQDGWSVVRLGRRALDRCADCSAEGRREPNDFF